MISERRTISQPRVQHLRTRAHVDPVVLGAARTLPKFPVGLFFVALFVITSRGLLEITVGKTAAYALQAATAVVLVLTLVVKGRPRASSRALPAGMLWWLLLISALLSVFASADNVGASAAITYSLVMVFFGTLLFLGSGVEYLWAPTRGIGTSIAAVVFMMVLVAVLQQFFGLTTFPGTDLGTLRTEARPSALTGSFLHYPIVLSLLSFVAIGIYAESRRRLLLLAGVVGISGVLVSYSRSGMVIVLIGLAVGLMLFKNTRVYVRALALVPVALVIILVAAPAGTYFDRFLSIFQSDGAGNTGRIDKWKLILDLWAQSPLFIGVHAGQFTNITSNLGSADAISPESGLLQVLVSFGLLGVVGYYGLMLLTVRATAARPVWYRAGLIAAVLQSFVYQSVEVLPYMLAFALTPMIRTRDAHIARLMHPHSAAVNDDETLAPEASNRKSQSRRVRTEQHRRPPRVD